jgi:UDPglucose 6-dehydrogenase
MRISVVGLGKLGSPLAAMLAARGHQVLGVDSNPAVLRTLGEGRAPVPEPGLQELVEEAGQNLRVLDDIGEAVASSEVTYVIVPTPSGDDGEFSLDLLAPAVSAVGSAIAAKKGRHVLAVTSTVMPGHCDGPIRETLEAAARRPLGEDLGLVYNPEFVALGSVVADMSTPDLVLIGESHAWAGDLVESVALSICANEPHVARMSLVDAEVTKLAVNTFVTTRISYANMLAEICERLPGADASVVTAALGHDSRIGTKYLRPATAYGGPCFPRDNVALSALARRLGAHAELAEATHRVNRHQVERLATMVDKQVSPGEGVVAVLGLSYKPGTPVVEESVGLLLAGRLARTGHKVVAYDPMAATAARAVLDGGVEVTESLPSCISDAAVAVLTTPWPELADLSSGAPGMRVIDCWRHVDPGSIPPGGCLFHTGRGSLDGLEADRSPYTGPDGR